MRYQLDPAIRLGAHQIAVICGVRLHHFHFGCSCIFQGEKTPAYILLKHRDVVQVFKPSGDRIKVEDMERECREVAAAAFVS